MEKELLFRYLKCETSQDEEILLSEWLDADPENQKELVAMQLMMEGLALHAPKMEQMSIPTHLLKTTISVKLAKIFVAASILLVIAAGIGYSHFTNKLKDLSEQKTIVEVPDGQRINITLSDGTEVCLNAGSKLEYPSVFLGSQRRIRLTGEAMFEVKHNAERPFVIETFACDVEVLGTKFNIESEEVFKTFSVALIEGSIKLTSRLKGEGPITMKANEEVNLVNGHLELGKIRNYDEYLWTKGIISIHNIGFEDLIKKIQKIYNVQIDIKCKNIPKINYTRGKIRVSDGIDHALRVLQSASDFTYTKDSDTGTITIL